MADLIGKIKSNFLGQNNFKVGFNNNTDCDLNIKVDEEIFEQFDFEGLLYRGDGHLIEVI